MLNIIYVVYQSHTDLEQGEGVDDGAFFFIEYHLKLTKISSLGSEVLRQLVEVFTPNITHAFVMVLLLKHNAFVFTITHHYIPEA